MLQKGECVGTGLDFKNYSSFDESVKKKIKLTQVKD